LRNKIQFPSSGLEYLGVVLTSTPAQEVSQWEYHFAVKDTLDTCTRFAMGNPNQKQNLGIYSYISAVLSSFKISALHSYKSLLPFLRMSPLFTFLMKTNFNGIYC